MSNGKRGRPPGFRMSEESKRAISYSKTGQRHKQITKDKISKTLMVYFKKLHPLSEEIARRYGRLENEEFNYWIVDNKESIDIVEDVRTERAMRNSRRIELAYGQNIEYFSHDLTPETLLILKEDLESQGVSLKEASELL